MPDKDDRFNVKMEFDAEKLLPNGESKPYPRLTLEYFDESRETLLVLEGKVEEFIGGLFAMGRERPT